MNDTTPNLPQLSTTSIILSCECEIFILLLDTFLKSTSTTSWINQVAGTASVIINETTNDQSIFFAGDISLVLHTYN